MKIVDGLRALIGGPADLPKSGSGASRPRLSLALQGGGSFGAFAWGVLDRLLEADIAFDAVSGASAGAVNAVLLASGLARGGPDGARTLLARFWKAASEAARLHPVASMAHWTAPLLSPYQFNPLDFSPLRTLLQADVDFERLRRASPLRLIVGATRVSDGRLRLFRETELTVEAVLASACLPNLAQAVEIEGEAYWDGGYSANPPLIPLVRTTAVPDVLVVQIIPGQVSHPPRTASDIARRMAQITFNASLLRDLETLESLTDVGQAPLPALFRMLDPSARLRLHRIAAQDHVANLATADARDLGWHFLTRLHDAGRDAAHGWLTASAPAAASASVA